MSLEASDRPDRVARAFYAMLQREGFEDEQIVDLATQLVQMVTAELREQNDHSSERLAAK